MKTGTMDGFGRSREHASVPRDAGLVLLHAPNFDEIPGVFPLAGEVVVVGREPPPGGLAIPQSAVSRLHARLCPRGGSWLVADVGSRNGVLVGGRFVREALLRPNDELRIGDAIFKYIPDGAAAFARYRIDGTVTGARLAPRTELLGGALIDAVGSEIATLGASDLTVLVSGETGTGKELVARSLHSASGRRGKLVALNCAALPANLVESELFGFRRGAFTGADRDHPGLVRAAHGGTLVLDEIGDMPLEAQAKLLRMLEAREIIPLGGAQPEKVDVRVVCATHRHLQELVDEKRFRADLFARIQGCTITLPPLRHRKEDLFLLVRHFLRLTGHSERAVSFAFMTNVCQHDWPYNVRELESAVRRAVTLAETGELDAAHLPDTVRRAMEGYGAPREESSPRPSVPAPSSSPISRGPPSADAIRAALAEHQGNVAAVARHFGKDRAQVHRWLRMHGISPDAYRDPT